jgi:hypothetical protein
MNAIFGVGIITFYTNPFNDIINIIMNYINLYNDNIIISKILLFINKLKIFLIDLLEVKSINKEIIEVAQPKVEDYLQLKDYNQNIIEKNSNRLSNFLFYSGLILIIGGISLYTYDN